jgi:hypothetical protein
VLTESLFILAAAALSTAEVDQRVPAQEMLYRRGNQMSIRRVIQLACAVAALTVVAASGTAATLNRATHFTFTTPVRLTGVLLPPGAYVFEIANPNTSSNVVRVLDRKRSKVYVTAITLSVTRPVASRLDATVVFAEATASTPRRISAWYPAGDTTGRQFLQ